MHGLQSQRFAEAVPIGVIEQVGFNGPHAHASAELVNLVDGGRD